MKSFQRALGFLRPYWLITLGAFVSLILMTGANLVSPRILSDIIDRGISNNDTQHLFWASLLLVGIAVVRSVFTFTQGYWSEKSSQAAAYDMRNSPVSYTHLTLPTNREV